MNPTLSTELTLMHTFRRPAGSPAELAFIRRYVSCLPNAWQDYARNWHVEVGDTPTTLYSCHTDTVNGQGGRQRVVLKDGRLSLARNYAKGKDVTSGCLGADDTVGVFLCRQMILAGVPGHYIFHYGEESGCIGSRELAEDSSEWLSRFRHAIAFDRKGYSDVITHQIGMRTCSQTFAFQLSAMLNIYGLQYQPSDRGLYTDTMSYAHIIPECTNVSIGYADNHSSDESVDVRHVLRLLKALLTFHNAHTLPADRDPLVYPTDDLDRYCRLDGSAYEYVDTDWIDPDWPKGSPASILPLVKRNH